MYNLGRQILFDKKGSSLAIVLMVLAIMMILVVSLGTLSISEVNFSSHQLNRTQAYYAARSGVQTGLKRLEKATTDTDYIDITTLYNDIKTNIDKTVGTGSSDTYNVQFLLNAANTQIKILGTGTSKGINDTTALTVEFTEPYGYPNNWVNPGGIISRGEKEQTSSPVVINTAKLLGHAPKKETNNDTTWKTPALHFIDGPYSLEITAKTLTIISNLVSFRNPVYIKGNSGGSLDDSLIFKTFDAAGFVDPAVIPGNGVIALQGGIYSDDTHALIFPVGYYQFVTDMSLMDSGDRTLMLTEITDTDAIERIKAIIRANTALTFTPTSMRWSEN